jgi:hypothetical protein
MRHDDYSPLFIADFELPIADLLITGVFQLAIGNRQSEITLKGKLN